MQTSHAQFEGPDRINHRVLQELQMALQHLEHAQKSSRQAADRQYYLSWCGKHVEKARWLATTLERMLNTV